MADSSVDWDEEELAGIAQAVDETTLAIEADAPGESLPARSPVADTVGDATVVGLGETGHGIRECFQLRHQLLRVLVEELGYRDIGLEVDFSATAQLNQYLSTGQGSAEAALAVEGFYDFWECQSMLALVEWARSFNEGRDTADQIRFHGIDVQNGRPTLTALDSYLDTVDPTVRDQLAESFQSVLDQRVGVKGQPDDPDEYGDTCREIAAVLDERFTDKRATYIERSSRRAYERAKRQVEHVDRLADLVPNRYGDDQQTAMQLRESGMADTVSWLLERESTDQLVVLAHNSHVKYGDWPGDQFDGQTAMGELLDQSDGIDYRAVGYSVGTGEARVISPPDLTWETIQIPDPPTGSLPDVHSRLDAPTGLIDFDRLPDVSPAREWLAAQPVRQEIASMAHEDPTTYVESDPRTDFDAILYVDEVTPSQAIEGDV